jgi:glycosyltransferase involved in cell wall biosynthesis
MRLVHLSPGSGDNFYCENCLRDAAMVTALRRIGHDASSVPLYLPLMSDEGLDQRLGGRVFFGGINVYLQQKSALFRKTPRWLDRLLDAPWLLRRAGRRSGMTAARDVAETMLSVLRGEEGRQAKELERLVAYLAEHERPDVISLSNALLVGVVRRMKEVLRCPVICSLQDEEGYVDALAEPQRSQAWDILRQRAAEVDAFIAPSEFYRQRMQERLGLPAERFHTIPNAVDAAALAPAAAPPQTPTIGFLSQMSAAKGLDTLVEAFILLRRSGRMDRLRLSVFGGMTGADEPLVRRVRGRLADAGLTADAAFAGDLPSAASKRGTGTEAANSMPPRSQSPPAGQTAFDPARKLAFLQSCSVVSVPTRAGESFGLFVLEALACGVPVVLPDHGAFGELVADTGGGLLCRPNDPPALAAALEQLLTDPARAAELGRRGRQAVLDRYNPDRMARDVERLCLGL